MSDQRHEHLNPSDAPKSKKRRHHEQTRSSGLTQLMDPAKAAALEVETANELLDAAMTHTEDKTANSNTAEGQLVIKVVIEGLTKQVESLTVRFKEADDAEKELLCPALIKVKSNLSKINA